MKHPTHADITAFQNRIAELEEELKSAEWQPIETAPMTEDTITVCSECLQASCWQGEFMCDNAKSAGTVEKTRQELEKLNLEHKSYWAPMNGYGWPKKDTMEWSWE